jgi:hypothetical protein
MVDEQLFASLKTAGLKDADARHFMYAVHNGCDRFVTTDPDFLDRRTQLQALGRGILIQSHPISWPNWAFSPCSRLRGTPTASRFTTQ